MDAKPNNMVPIIDLNGNIADYSVTMSEADQKNHLRQNNEIASVMGATLSHIGARETAYKNNQELFDVLIEESNKVQKDQFLVPPGYIRISPDPAKKKTKLSESWYALPPYIRDYIEMKTGDNSLVIKKEYLINLNGYNDWSFSQLKWNGRSIIDYPEIAHAIQFLEHYWKNAVKNYKAIIVKYLPAVVIGNATSNMWVAMRHGISPAEYVESFINKWDALIEYEKDNQELASVQLRLDAKDFGNDSKGILLTRKKVLEKSLNSNPMKSLIDDGQYSAIIEDLESGVSKRTDHSEATINRLIEKLARKLSTGTYKEDAWSSAKITKELKELEKELIPQEKLVKELETKKLKAIAKLGASKSEKERAENQPEVIKANDKYNKAKKELKRLKERKETIKGMGDPKNALEEKIKQLRDVLYVSKGSTAYDFIEKLTAYNDIANRGVIQEKMEEKLKLNKNKYKNLAAYEKAKDDILNYLDQLFVNYNYLDPKSVKYLNDMGLLMFTKFFFRVAKAEVAAAKRNPLNYLFVGAIDTFAIDIESPTDQYRHPMDTFFNKFGKANPFDVAAQLVEPRIFQPITGV